MIVREYILVRVDIYKWLDQHRNNFRNKTTITDHIDDFNDSFNFSKIKIIHQEEDIKKRRFALLLLGCFIQLCDSAINKRNHTRFLGKEYHLILQFTKK